MFNLGQLCSDLPLQPGHTTKLVIAMVQLAANQFLVFTNFKDFNSSTMLIDPIIILSQIHQSFSIMVEVDTDDIVFTPVEDGFYPGDRIDWVKCVTSIEVFCSGLASLTIIDGQPN